MCEILPGILEKEWEAIEKKIEIVKPLTTKIHLDIIDGKFASNTSFLDPKPFQRYTDDIFFELHMMVEEPEAYLEKWANVGIKRFLGHVEKMSDQVGFVARAEKYGEVGLALDGKTDTSQINVPLVDLDTLLIMTINAGFSGQKLIPETLTKVTHFQKMMPFLPIIVDGGINRETIHTARTSGATRFVATSALFEKGEFAENFSNLQTSCQNED